MNNFNGFGLSAKLLQSLAHIEYTTPTPIQAKAIPIALSGRDIIGSAQTGTGKTAAFAIPMVERLMNSPQGSALVLSPTRELAKQTMDFVTSLLGPQSRIKTAFLIGGESMGKQCMQLSQRPRLIVATPGRLADHISRNKQMLSETSFLVLDETDRMLDMGFAAQIERIVRHLPRERQTLMFSATFPENILKLSRKYLNNPERIAIGSVGVPATKISQKIINVGNGEKFPELVRQLGERSGSVIIFVRTKRGTEKLAKKLKLEKFEAEAIHGDLRQNQRDRIILKFRQKGCRVLVATDILARGLDVPHIEHVINYDLPQAPEEYIHRIGRTARAGAEGEAVCLISPEDNDKWREIEKLLKSDKNTRIQHSGESRTQKNVRKHRNPGRKKIAA